MGVDPFLVASSVNLIVAQRLVRRICEHCKEVDRLEPSALIEAGFSAVEAPTLVVHRGKGCSRCGGTGYKGRVGLFEVMASSENIRRLILENAPVSELRRQAIAEGMVTLRECGLQMVREKLTTVDDVVRETVV
jgi:type IV pilus assembly protein PilB